MSARLAFASALAGLILALGGAPAPAAEPKPEPPPARAAVAPAAPVLPAELVAALQDGRYADALKRLGTLEAEAGDGPEGADRRAYYALLRGIALRLESKPDEAREALGRALRDAPRSRWAAKIRFELAAVELAAGRPEKAEELARVEAEALLDAGRKDRLAGLDEAFARSLLKPADPLTAPDPNAAHELLERARALARGRETRARLLYAMARARQAAGAQPQAIAEFQQYLGQHPEGAQRFEAREHLGEAQLAAGQPPAARLTWTDLARDLGKLERTRDQDQIRARALYRVASTYGMPAPGSDAALNLGVAALRRFLEAYPAHPWAVKAAYEIGAAYLARGKGQQALEAFGRFLKEEDAQAETDEARRDLAQLTMTATFQLGQILQGQQKFDEAIAAWKGYLAKFPNGPQSADAQRAILDTQLLAAADHLARERFAEARAAWQAFVAQNPLDGRVPQVLYQIGESFTLEKKPERAIAAWEPLLGKFPGSEPAAHAQFLIASIFETEKGDPAGAIERFKAIQVDPWRAQALQRVAVMEAKSLTVVTPRVFRSGEEAHLKITSRNLETLTFTAYRLGAEAYFRKKHALEGVESLDIGLVAPDAEWTAPVPDYARYRPVEAKYALKVAVPGVYVVKVTDEKELQATTLVVGSDIDAIVKASREQVLVFAQDMKTGKGRAGARVLLADGEEVVLEGKTGPDGVLLKEWGKPRSAGAALRYLVLDGPDAAGSGLGVPERVAQGLSPRAYLYTDRPAYRPGQRVEIRGVVREVEGGRYAARAGSAYRLEVTDARGRRIVAREVKLSAFGTFHAALPLDEGAAPGTYRVRLHRPGGSDFAGQFEVQSYRLEPIDLKVDFKKTVFFRGETVEATVEGRYQYGAPLANRPIEVALPDGRTVRGATDASGKYRVSFPTEGFAEEQVLPLVARLPQDNVAAAAAVRLAVRAFNVVLETTRDVYLDGETFALKATTLDAQGEPTGQELVVSVLKQVAQAGRVTEREVSRKRLTTDPKTGQGTVSLSVDDEQGGAYVLRAAGTDRFGNPVVAERAVSVSGKKDETTLRLLADRQAYKVREEASVNLHSRGGAGTALVTWEADRILKYRLVTLEQGDNPLGWAVDGDQFPNFTLAAARMAGRNFDEARLDVRVERELRVTLEPKRAVVGPGDEVELELRTTDQLGRPVSAELSVALVDRSLLRLYGDRLPRIGPYFYDQVRTGAFASASTNTFHYEPATTPVAGALVEEQERAAAQAANATDLDRVLGLANKQAAVAADEAKDAPAASAGTPPPPAGPVSGVEAKGKGRAGGRKPGQLPAGVYFNGSGALADNAEAGFFGFDGARGTVDAEGESLRLSETDADGKERLLRQESFGKRVDLAARDSRRKAGAAAQVRERFVETAYWNPAVVTDERGRATVTFRAPAALSQYQFTARGATGADTLVGQAGGTLTVRKDFFVDLRTPAALTQGDRPRFLAKIHHSGVSGRARVRLTVYAGGRDQVFPAAVELKGDGVDEVLFEAVEVPDADVVRLTLAAEAGDAKDELVSEVKVRPWGVQAFASASGTAGDETTAFVALPAGRRYESPEMLLVVSPTLRRMLVELALGGDRLPSGFERCLPPAPETTADRAGDLLAACSALAYLRGARGAEAPEAARLEDRIRGLVAELTAAQAEDGGWPWVAGAAPGQPRPSERTTSARVAWALAAAAPLGLLPDPAALEKAATYLTQQLAQTGAADTDARAMIVHALSARGKASFEQANSLNRLRQGLSDAALAYVALTFANLDRKSLAAEVLDVLGPRSKAEPAGAGERPRQHWSGSARASDAEATALAALAFARARPRDARLAPAVDWLLAHRVGDGWQPRLARGPALAALAGYYGEAEPAEDRYALVASVNGREVLRMEVAGSAESKAVLVPRDALNLGGPNRVHFDFQGRGTFGYAATLTGFARDFAPEQDRAGKTAVLDRRVYHPAAPELDGKTLPTGFSVAPNTASFENLATQVPLGGRAQVELFCYRNVPVDRPDWQREFLVVEESIPAGCTLIEGTVQSSAAAYRLDDGVLRFYFAPDQYPGTIRYDVFGDLPGRYRALPASVRDAYNPGRVHLGQPNELRVLAPGEPDTDPYKATPDELYARGKALFEAGKLAQAGEPLEQLFAGYSLRDDVAKDAARMLLTIAIGAGDARRIVRYFEVVREKAPETVIGFDDLHAIGAAYREIGEAERAYLVWRGAAEASYLEDARLGEVLRQRGRTLEAVAYLIGLWREYPETAAIESDFFGLSQLLAQDAAKAPSDPALRRTLASAGVTPSELLLQSIRMVQTKLALSPRDPLADEASLALVGSFLELQDYSAVVRLASRFAKLYPRSNFQDSFQYAEALGRFHLGEYDRAIEVAEAIAKATYRDASGAEVPSPNKWQALYILGQIYDARGEPAKALPYYDRVADRFTDAAGAVRFFRRKALELPEVTVIRPGGPAAGSVPVVSGLRAVAPSPPATPAGGSASAVTLDYRNIAEAEVRVYPVDLMRLYLTRRTLEGVAGIDLAGITPLHDATVRLGTGDDFAGKHRRVELPLAKEGAYLVMARGGDVYASGIALVTPLELEVLEEPDAGRVRVSVRDAATGARASKVQVKVIGTMNPEFISGETDLRGVFVAEGVRGEVTAVARQGSSRYAFYRGKTFVGPRPEAATAGRPAPANQPPQENSKSLDKNVREQNNFNQQRQIERLRERYQEKAMPGAAAKDFF